MRSCDLSSCTKVLPVCGMIHAEILKTLLELFTLEPIYFSDAYSLRQCPKKLQSLLYWVLLS